MHIGIDLGTTYCCVGFIDNDGNVKTISNSDGEDTTPSVVWFDGKVAYVGNKANDRKITPTSPIYEEVKRDIGKSPSDPKLYSYEINGYYFGAKGISAIILRKLKKDAITYFKRLGILQKELDEKSISIPAFITVPASFGDLQKSETRDAGYAAGLNVVGIINEPTAASLAYGKKLKENKKVLVFDLGGGTCDITILNMYNSDSIVKASEGNDQLGGKDWDKVIIEYLYAEYKKRSGNDIPDDMGWDIQQKAIDAKFELTEKLDTTVIISCGDGDVEIPLYRSAPEVDNLVLQLDLDEDLPFYFEQRCSDLLSNCQALLEKVLDISQLFWSDIDDIVLAGGACRMPMIPKLIEELSQRKILRQVPGFSYDTAIAFGAAIYGMQPNKVKDVASKTVGIEVEINGDKYIEHLIKKNTPLPIEIERQFTAVENAIVKVYEGESNRAEECILRGRLELKNPAGMVRVNLKINQDGILECQVKWPPDESKMLRIKTDDVTESLEELKNRIAAIDIRL